MNALRIIGDLFINIFHLFAGFLRTTGPTSNTKRSVLNQPIVAVIALAVIVISLASLALSHWRHSSKADVTPFAAFGEILGRETSRLVGNKGNVVLVIYDPARFQTASDKARLNAFNQALRKAGQARIVATEKIPLPFGMPDLAAGIPADKFTDIVRRHASCAAIVLFCGAPS